MSKGWGGFPREWYDALLRKSGEGALFDDKVISADVKCAKPARQFFDALKAIAPEGSVFVDDREVNCTAAADAGYKALWAYPGRVLADEIEELLSEQVAVGKR